MGLPLALIRRLRRAAANVFQGNPTSENLTDESALVLTDESGANLADSGA